MAGEPADPMDAVLQEQGLSRNQINAQNDQDFRSYMREQNGPIYIPPMHRDHAWLADHARKTANGFVVDKDNQGSIREMIDGSGNIVAQYSYDPYGNATKLQGSMDSDFQYAGYYFHAPSGLLLTQTRAYSPVLGRFISRDPIEEAGGVNLYAYCENNPIGFRDPSGLQAYNKINNGEVLSDITQVGPIESVIGRSISIDAVKTANASGLPGILHGPRNAYQHCLWSCMMAKSIGQNKARSIANNHEISGNSMGQLPDDEAMDQANNAAGRQAAKCGRPCKDSCMDLLNSGGLLGRGGIPVNLLYGPGF
jgi:RHS repeat-associated protein